MKSLACLSFLVLLVDGPLVCGAGSIPAGQTYELCWLAVSGNGAAGRGASAPARIVTGERSLCELVLEP